MLRIAAAGLGTSPLALTAASLEAWAGLQGLVGPRETRLCGLNLGPRAFGRKVPGRGGRI